MRMRNPAVGIACPGRDAARAKRSRRSGTATVRNGPESAKKQENTGSLILRRREAPSRRMRRVISWVPCFETPRLRAAPQHEAVRPENQRAAIREGRSLFFIDRNNENAN